MEVMLTLLLLFGLSFDVGHKCDNYFFGNVNYRGVADDHTATLQGCKKGCFYNYTVTEEGVPKCEKCSEISDEKECLSHAATCQWTKGGKCATQSCPNIAKIRVALAGDNDQSTIRSQTEYRELVSKETECVEGSALEKKYNDMYLSDYVATYNYRFPVWNVDDTCTRPRSTQIQYDPITSIANPYAWENVKTTNATVNAAACNKFIGFTYVADATTPTPVPLNDQCNPKDCYASSIATRADCNGVAGCIWQWGTNGSDAGGGCVSAESADACILLSSGNLRWRSGTNNSEDCQKVEGCRYIRGEPWGFSWVEDPPYSGNYVQRRDDYRVDTSASALSTTDTCVPACTGFVAGTNGRRHCEELGCTYSGYDYDERPLENLRTFLDSDPCPAERHGPTDRDARVGDCGINATLEHALLGYTELCDDRIYSGDPVQCDIPELTTEESCIAGYGNWTPLPKTCRKLPSTVRQICEFNERNATGSISGGGLNIYYVWATVGKHGGNRKQGTLYDRCVRYQYDQTDPWKTKNITSWDNQTSQLAAYLTPDDRERIYGFKTPEDYCKHDLEVRLKECQTKYEDAVRLCHKEVTSAEINPTTWARPYERVKATRSACHRIYGCMYSKSNERCSVWAVWAFVLILVLTIVVFVAVVVVGGIVLGRVFGLSSA